MMLLLLPIDNSAQWRISRRGGGEKLRVMVVHESRADERIELAAVSCCLITQDQIEVGAGGESSEARGTMI